MGAGIVLKKIDERGNPVYVKLSGIEKARVYEMLAKFGIYEMESGERLPTNIGGIEVIDHEEVQRFDKTKVGVSQPEGKMLKADLNKRLEVLDKIDASTMHCCEAAEILFEDIT